MIRRHPTSPLFPYTTLFRSHGTADESVPWGDGRDLRKAARDDATDLFLVDGAGHTFGARHPWAGSNPALEQVRSEEHTSELQSLTNLVCRLLLEKKNKKTKE